MQEALQTAIESEGEFQLTPFAPKPEPVQLPAILPMPRRSRDGWWEIPPGHSVGEYSREHFDVPFIDHEVEAEKEECLEPDPYWEKLGARGEGAQALFDAGLKKKAFRYADCNARAEKVECSRSPGRHKFFKRYHCLNRFCKYCGKFHRARLQSHYESLLVAFLRDRERASRYTLARVNFTMRCNGEVPTREQVRSFNQAVRMTVRRAVEKILQQRAADRDDSVLVKKKRQRGDALQFERVRASVALESRRVAHGILFSDEVGFETRGHIPDSERTAHGLNLHAHGIFYGPFPKDWREGWEIFRDTWREETQRAFGEESHGVWITHLKGWRSNPVPEIKDALYHLLKYISKCPYDTVKRMAELELVFDHTRRVHAGGLWHGLKEPDGYHAGSGYCPLCRSQGHESRLFLRRRLLPTGGEIPEYWPVKLLREQGYLDLEKVSRKLGFDPYESGGP